MMSSVDWPVLVNALICTHLLPWPKKLRQARTSNYRRVHAREITRLCQLAHGCPNFFGQGSTKDIFKRVLDFEQQTSWRSKLCCWQCPPFLFFRLLRGFWTCTKTSKTAGGAHFLVRIRLFMHKGNHCVQKKKDKIYVSSQCTCYMLIYEIYCRGQLHMYTCSALCLQMLTVFFLMVVKKFEKWWFLKASTGYILFLLSYGNCHGRSD